MEIPGLSPSGFRADFEAAREVLALRKQRDVEQQRAQALIQLVQQATDNAKGQLIDVRV
jgi:hypothetical protein